MTQADRARKLSIIERFTKQSPEAKAYIEGYMMADLKAQEKINAYEKELQATKRKIEELVAAV